MTKQSERRFLEKLNVLPTKEIKFLGEIDEVICETCKQKFERIDRYTFIHPRSPINPYDLLPCEYLLANKPANTSTPVYEPVLRRWRFY